MIVITNMCDISECSLETEIGLLEISCCNNGVHSIHICEEGNTDTLFSKPALKKADLGCMVDTVNWLKGYFGDKPTKRSPSICPKVLSSKGPFTEQVWTTLMTTVAAGSIVSYGDLAALCGRDGAARAVGTAMRRNPVPILVPCHRVVKSGSGGIGRYSGGGTHVKEWLLKHEGADIS